MPPTGAMPHVCLLLADLGLLQRDQNVIAFYLDGKRPQASIFVVRRCARIHVEHPAVPGANDLVAVHYSLPERSAAMNTHVVYRR